MSTVPVIVIRPEPGNTATAAAARDLGLAVEAFPLFTVEPMAWDCPDPARYDALLAGSANVFRCGGDDLARLRLLPVHAVGEVTGDAARDAGFVTASTGAGGLQAVLDRLPGQRLLRLAGSDHVTLIAPAGTMIDTRIVYAVLAAPLSQRLAALLRRPVVVLLHSGEAARHFAQSCDAAGVPRAAISLACLAPRIAKLAGNGWNEIQISAARSDPALLALAGQMCDKIRFGGAG